MARRIRIDVIVTGVFIGSMLALVACGCHSAGTPASGVQTAAETAAITTPQGATGAQGTPPGAGDQTRQTQSAGGKPDELKPPVDLAMRFSAGSTATYRAVLEQERTVTWQGDESAKPPQFKDGRSGARIEVTFGQTVETVDADGSAVVRITIEGLKYAGAVRNNVALEFDSHMGGDPNRPLAKLISQNYRIRLSRRGEVLEIVDAQQARSTVAGDSPEHQVAQRLLSDEEIRDRHAVAAMVALKDAQVRPGQQWSSVKAFSFGWMGSKSFERVYTLSEVTERDGRRVAVVEMKAIPSAAMAEQPQPQQAGGLGQMFDSTDNYNGRLELDLGSGQVRESAEQMRSEWVVADPQTMQGGSKPSALRMTAMRLNRLELVK